MTAPWSCTACGETGVRNVGTEGHCARHLAELYAQFDPAVFELNGVGLPGISIDDNHLSCCACDATWFGVAGERCRWCDRAYTAVLEWQAEMVLRPPTVDPDDRNHDARTRAWGERLVRATDAGIIDRGAAQSAWRRQVNHHAVAA